MNTLVLDNGSAYIKAAISKQGAPVIVESFYALKSVEKGFDESTHKSQHYYEQEAHQLLDKNPNYFEMKVISKGMINNMDDYEQLLLYIFKTKLHNFKPIGNAVLIVDSICDKSKEHKERKMLLTEFMIERMKFSKISYIPSPLLTLYGCSKSTGLVIDCGHEITQIANVYQGDDGLIKTKIKIIECGGKWVNEVIKMAYEKHLNESISLSKAEQLKPNIASINKDGNIEVLLPGKDTPSIGYSLFNSSQHKIPYFKSLSSIIKKIVKCTQTIPPIIVICGGTSNLKGFKEYVISIIKQELPQVNEPLAIYKIENEGISSMLSAFGAQSLASVDDKDFQKIVMMDAKEWHKRIPIAGDKMSVSSTQLNNSDLMRSLYGSKVQKAQEFIGRAASIADYLNEHKAEFINTSNYYNYYNEKNNVKSVQQSPTKLIIYIPTYIPTAQYLNFATGINKSSISEQAKKETDSMVNKGIAALNNLTASNITQNTANIATALLNAGTKAAGVNFAIDSSDSDGSSLDVMKALATGLHAKRALKFKYDKELLNYYNSDMKLLLKDFIVFVSMASHLMPECVEVVKVEGINNQIFIDLPSYDESVIQNIQSLLTLHYQKMFVSFTWEQFNTNISVLPSMFTQAPGSFKDYRNLTVEKRINEYGPYTYYYPKGWVGIGLNVLGKYDGGNNDWLSKENGWITAYHGLRTDPQKVAKLIAETGFRAGAGQVYSGSTDTNIKSDRCGQYCEVGIYTSPHIETSSTNYCTDTNIGGKNYYIAFQNKLKPSKIRIPTKSGDIKDEWPNDYWVVNDPKDIRPYRILFKELN